MTKSSNDKYTDPELRDKIKEEVQEGDKGGEPGQWSARKAQLMAKEYKAQGGGYKTDKKDDPAAQHLDKWTKEDWQTKDGDGNARSEEGTHRYLPKKAWEKMSESEKEATDEQKLEGSKAGDQYVENTDKAKRARKEVSDEDEDEADEEEEEEEEDKDNKKPPAKKAKKTPTKADKAKATKNDKKDIKADTKATKQKSAEQDVKKAEPKKAEPKKSQPKKSEKGKGKAKATKEDEEESDDDAGALIDEDDASDVVDEDEDSEDEFTGNDDDEFVPEK